MGYSRDLEESLGLGTSREHNGPSAKKKPRAYGLTDQRQGKPPSESNVKPDLVSDRVWNATLEWIQVGTSALGHRPPVNTRNFSLRLHGVVNSSPSEQVKLMRRKYGSKFFEYYDEIIHHAINGFWEGITSAENEFSLQMSFLYDDWDDLMYYGRVTFEAGLIRNTRKSSPPAEMLDIDAVLEPHRLRRWAEKVATTPIDDAPEPQDLAKLQAFRDRIHAVHHEEDRNGS